MHRKYLQETSETTSRSAEGEANAPNISHAAMAADSAATSNNKNIQCNKLEFTVFMDIFSISILLIITKQPHSPVAILNRWQTALLVYIL